jgi:hypothetical protein
VNADDFEEIGRNLIELPSQNLFGGTEENRKKSLSQDTLS